MPQETAKSAVSLWVWWGAISPVIMFILGFLTSRFTMSKTDRLAAAQTKFSVARELSLNQNTAYQQFAVALAEYASSKKKKPTISDFMKISVAGQNFLYQQRLVADAILSDKVDDVSRDKTLIKSLKDTAERTIPKIYETLKEIADKNGLPQPDQFKKSDYQSIYDAVEKYGTK